MSTLETAVKIAAEAHAGQTDKAGEPYILHCARVMLRGSTLDERIVGILHDVVEDTEWTSDGLREAGFSEGVVQAVAALTRHDGEPYELFILRASLDPIARRVKISDLQDNMNLPRIESPTSKDRKRQEKYQAAYERLSSDEGTG